MLDESGKLADPYRDGGLPHRGHLGSAGVTRMITRNVLWLQGEWAVDHQWPEWQFAHFRFSNTLDTTSHVYSILSQCPISLFADEKLNI